MGKKNKKLIGWREWLSLPELGVPAIKAKVDTGAKTSALHAFRLRTFTRGGRKHVRFWLHPMQRKKDIELVCEAPIHDRRVVKDSGGHEEERYVIKTPLNLNGETWPVEITLTSRENMAFRMLLGRSAISKTEYVIDPAQSYVAGTHLGRVYRRKKLKNSGKQDS